MPKKNLKNLTIIIQKNSTIFETPLSTSRKVHRKALSSLPTSVSGENSSQKIPFYVPQQQSPVSAKCTKKTIQSRLPEINIQAKPSPKKQKIVKKAKILQDIINSAIVNNSKILSVQNPKILKCDNFAEKDEFSQTFERFYKEEFTTYHFNLKKRINVEKIRLGNYRKYRMKSLVSMD